MAAPDVVEALAAAAPLLALPVATLVAGQLLDMWYRRVEERSDARLAAAEKALDRYQARLRAREAARRVRAARDSRAGGAEDGR